jgi:hypothetical protein
MTTTKSNPASQIHLEVIPNHPSRNLHPNRSFFIALLLFFLGTIIIPPTQTVLCQGCLPGQFWGDYPDHCNGEYVVYTSRLYSCDTDCQYMHWVGECPNGIMHRWQREEGCGAPPPPVDTVSITQNQVVCDGTGGGGWCNGGAILYLTASDTLSHVITFGGDVSGGNPLVVPLPEGEGTLNFTATCSNGASASGSASYRLDLTPPLVSFTLIDGVTGANGWYLDGPVSLICSGSDALSGFDGIVYGNQTADGDGVWVLDCTAYDVAGNSSSTGEVVGIDGTPPVIDGYLSGGTVGTNGWYTAGPVSLICDATDATSGVYGVGYGVQTATGEGTTTLDCFAFDNAGNSDVGSLDISIDSQPPTASLAYTGTSGTGGWYTSDVSISVISSDATSGVASVDISVDGVAGTLATGDGTHSVSVLITDNAGNTTTLSGSVNIDTTLPSTAFSTGSGWVRGTVSIEGTSSDATSGIAQTYISTDGGATWIPAGTGGNWSYAWDTTSAGDGAHIIQAYSTDLAGNTGPVASLTLYVDNTAPGVTLSPANVFLGSSTTIISTDTSSGVYFARLTISGNGIAPRVIDIPAPSGSDVIQWDGLDGNGDTAPIGIYTITAEIWDVVGNYASANGTWTRPYPWVEPSSTPWPTRTRTHTPTNTTADGDTVQTPVIPGGSGTDTPSANPTGDGSEPTEETASSTDNICLVQSSSGGMSAQDGSGSPMSPLASLPWWAYAAFGIGAGATVLTAGVNDKLRLPVGIAAAGAIGLGLAGAMAQPTAANNLSVPLRTQEEGSVECGAASLGMLFDYFAAKDPANRAPSNEELVDYMEGNNLIYEWGTGVEELAYTARQMGYEGSYSFCDAGMDKLDSELDAGRPVAVALRLEEYEGSVGHFVTVTGVSEDGGTYFVNDPALGVMSVPREKLENSWQANCSCGVVVLPRPVESIPASTLPLFGGLGAAVALAGLAALGTERKGIGAGLFSFVTKAVSSVTSAVTNTVKSVATTVTNTVKAAATTVAKTVTTAAKTVATTVKTAVSTVAKTVNSFVPPYVTAAVSSVAKTVSSAVKSVTTAVTNTIKTAATAVTNTVKAVSSAVVNTVKTVATTVKSVATTVSNIVKSAATVVSNTVKTIASTVKNVASVINEKVVSPVVKTLSSLAPAAVAAYQGGIWRGLPSTIMNTVASHGKIPLNFMRGFVAEDLWAFTHNANPIKLLTEGRAWLNNADNVASLDGGITNLFTGKTTPVQLKSINSAAKTVDTLCKKAGKVADDVANFFKGKLLVTAEKAGDVASHSTTGNVGSSGVTCKDAIYTTKAASTKAATANLTMAAMRKAAGNAAIIGGILELGFSGYENLTNLASGKIDKHTAVADIAVDVTCAMASAAAGAAAGAAIGSIIPIGGTIVGGIVGGVVGFGVSMLAQGALDTYVKPRAVEAIATITRSTEIIANKLVVEPVQKAVANLAENVNKSVVEPLANAVSEAANKVGNFFKGLFG